MWGKTTWSSGGRRCCWWWPILALPVNSSCLSTSWRREGCLCWATCSWETWVILCVRWPSAAHSIELFLSLNHFPPWFHHRHWSWTLFYLKSTGAIIDGQPVGLSLSICCLSCIIDQRTHFLYTTVASHLRGKTSQMCNLLIFFLLNRCIYLYLYISQ